MSDVLTPQLVAYLRQSAEGKGAPYTDIQRLCVSHEALRARAEGAEIDLARLVESLAQCRTANEINAEVADAEHGRAERLAELLDGESARAERLAGALREIATIVDATRAEAAARGAGGDN